MKKIYKPSKDTIKNALISKDQYNSMYKGASEQPDIFWAVQSKRLDWFKRPTTIKNTSFEGEVPIKWYEDGVLNACYNCVDRHLVDKANKTALIWEGDDPKDSAHVTFKDLHVRVSKAANALKELGIEKGERVVIYMPMVIEAVVSMLACARIGAVHSVVFGGFSPSALASRINDCGAKLVITADEGLRGSKKIPLKKNTDEAIKKCEGDVKTLVFKRTGGDIEWNDETNTWWHDIVERQSEECPCEEMNAEDPLFILYTSGSTGKPKGMLHTTGGYMVYASMTHELVFDVKPDDIYWCTADVGWVTGHSYIVYGPLANGTTSIVFEGIPNYPDHSRLWQVVDKHKVNIFYTAPTAIRALLKQGDDFVQRTSRESLRILGTVGEPINEEAWLWYYEVVGEKRCPIMDTWWQTETGGHMMTPLACHDLKPGSAMKPFFGVQPALLDGEGKEIEGEGEGALCIKQSWPGQARTIYGDHPRFLNAYFSAYPGYYFTGDGARRDKDGDIWITGRMDDVLNISGHRLGTAEIEDAIDLIHEVAESAVIGIPHDLTGQAIYVYATLRRGEKPSDELKKKIYDHVRTSIGPIAKIEHLQFAEALPKTRSGKIMRRILRKIACNETDQLGDISTLAEPEVVDALIAGRVNV